MCGICGFVSQDDEETLARMTAVLLHRGPDDSGLYLSQPTADGLRAGLGNRRLAILDLSAAGHMPMSDPERTLWITYNGEIYNYPQLRKELEAKGYRFRSKSDTEAIVYLYQSEGPEFVRRLNGMFAIAIWDERRAQLFLARDHFGIKPLYYFHQSDRLAFASEVKALLTAGLSQASQSGSAPSVSDVPVGPGSAHSLRRNLQVARRPLHALQRGTVADGRVLGSELPTREPQVSRQ